MAQDAATHTEGSTSPLFHARQTRGRFAELIDHLRADVERVDEPQFKAMFETAAEVLGGLVTAFQHYEQKNEGAWKRR